MKYLKGYSLLMVTVFLSLMICVTGCKKEITSSEVMAQEVQDIDALINKSKSEVIHQIEAWDSKATPMSLPEASIYNVQVADIVLYDRSFRTEFTFEKESNKLIGFLAGFSVSAELSDKEWNTIYSIIQHYISIYGDPERSDIEDYSSVEKIKESCMDGLSRMVSWGESSDLDEDDNQSITGIPVSVNIMQIKDDDGNPEWIVEVQNWSGLLVN